MLGKPVTLRLTGEERESYVEGAVLALHQSGLTADRVVETLVELGITKEDLAKCATKIGTLNFLLW